MSAPRNELNPGQLLAISDEVSRLATTLARLSTAQDVANTETRPDAAPNISARELNAIIRARRLRARFFDEELFADPAWDMLLELFLAELAQRRVAVSSLCIASAVPATTALRWIKALAQKGLIVRHGDPFDGRRVYVELTPEASQSLRAYFAEIEDIRAI